MASSLIKISCQCCCSARETTVDVCLATMGGCLCQVEVWKINMASQLTLEIYFKPIVDYSAVSGWDTKANQCHFFKCLFFKTHAYSKFASIIKKTFFPLNHLKITCPYDTLTFKYFSVHFLHTRTFYVTTIQPSSSRH